MSVASVISNAAQRITGAISEAARSTGISFEYLVTTAQIESRMNPKAEAPTSSASGLYQFIDQTWLATLKKAGPALGLGKYADAIGQTADGRYAVTDPDMQSAVMRLRHDPGASALMAGAFTRNNEVRLESSIGRQPTEGELYIAHFLGSGGAGRLISAAAGQPQANAVQMFPAAARANRSVFYDRQGNSRSVAGVYQELNRRYQVARNAAAGMGLLRGTIDPMTGTTSKLASASASAGIPQTPSGPARATEGLASARVAAPDPAATTQAYAIARQERPAASEPASASGGLPFFRAMFSDRAGAPVTPAVHRLWAKNTGTAAAGQVPAGPVTGTPTGTTAAPGQLNPLDLFVDHTRDPRALFGTRKT